MKTTKCYIWVLLSLSLTVNTSASTIVAFDNTNITFIEGKWQNSEDYLRKI